MDYRKQLGYVLEDKDIHVCGYRNNKILIQASPSLNVKELKLYDNQKGIFFNYQNKRIFVEKF